MVAAPNRVAVLNGVNLDMLGMRDASHYGSLTLAELELEIVAWASELGLEASTFQSNSEAEFVGRLHAARSDADGLIINAGAWTHYSWAIRDALEVAETPAVEVHLSDVMKREPWRHASVFEGLVVETISGKGADGYREALEVLKRELAP